MTRRFAILLDGPCEPTAALRAALAGTRVIAADGGMRHAGGLAVEPELWVGDFDSAPADLNAPGTPRIAHPVAKDATDGEIAVEAALARGAGSLLLVGGVGGPRFDHALGLQTLAVSLALRGLEVALTDGRQWTHPLVPAAALRFGSRGDTVSVVGLTDLRGLTLAGVRWPLDRADVPLGSSLTLSNEATGTVAASLVAGHALVVHGPGDSGAA